MHSGSNRPGITKTITLGDGWQRLGALYNSDYPTELKEGNTVASGVRLSVATYAAEIAYGDEIPTIAKGHVLADGHVEVYSIAAWITRAWLRNNAAGSNAVITVTPTFAL
jgi:hypothetical protein